MFLYGATGCRSQSNGCQAACLMEQLKAAQRCVVFHLFSSCLAAARSSTIVWVLFPDKKLLQKRFVCRGQEMASKFLVPLLHSTQSINIYKIQKLITYLSIMMFVNVLLDTDITTSSIQKVCISQSKQVSVRHKRSAQKYSEDSRTSQHNYEHIYLQLRVELFLLTFIRQYNRITTYKSDEY